MLLKNARILNVYSGETLKGDVLIEGERISKVGEGLTGGGEVLDLHGRFLTPGYIDPHFHPWFVYNPVSIGEFAAARGVTTLFCDNLLFYMLMGPGPFKRLMEALSSMPIRFLWFCRSDPQTPMEKEDDLFSEENIKKLISNPFVYSLGEITRWPQTIYRNPKILALIKYAKEMRKRVDGHTAGAKPHQVAELSGLGIDSCHEAINPQEALVRLRAGMYVVLRESSLRRDLRELITIVSEHGVPTDRLMLTTDCSSPLYYVEKGFLDYAIKICLESGVEPALCYRMVTLNPAVYFGLDHTLGGIAPGRSADMVVLEDLADPSPTMVISRGKVVAENGRLKNPFPKVQWELFFPPEWGFGDPERVKVETFRITGDGGKKVVRLPVIGLKSNVITELLWMELPVKDGFPDITIHPDLSYVSLVERRARWVSNGLIRGFSRVEALSSSFNTAAQILTIGRNPRAMEVATRRVMEMKGGIVVMEGERVAVEIPLPIGGVMSDRSLNELAGEEQKLRDLLRKKGYRFHDPLYTLVFLPCDFLPEVRINYHGVENIKTGEIFTPRRELG